MQPLSRQKVEQPVFNYDCPRCGDSLPCASEADLFQVTTHRLLHLALDWGPSFQPTTYWIADEDGPRPVVDRG